LCELLDLHRSGSITTVGFAIYAFLPILTCLGAFCAEVAVDSDIEQVVAERHRGAPAGVMATQRALLQRQFVEQITGAFQLIKVCVCISWAAHLCCSL
jgi:hypothetical protein